MAGSGLTLAQLQARSLHRIGLVRRRACALAPVTLYSDVDMAFEALPLATVSESTADAEEHRPSHEQVQQMGSQALDMGFEPPRTSQEIQVQGPRNSAEVRWHSVAPTDSDITTRPHRPLASRAPQATA